MSFASCFCHDLAHSAAKRAHFLAVDTFLATLSYLYTSLQKPLTTNFIKNLTLMDFHCKRLKFKKYSLSGDEAVVVVSASVDGSNFREVDLSKSDLNPGKD